MSPAEHKTGSRTITVFLSILLIVIVAVFVIAFVAVTISEVNEENMDANTESEIDAYDQGLQALLALDADPMHGSELIDEFQCGICHRQGAGQIAPSFDGITLRAEGRKPELTPEEYLYESIAFPNLYTVEGYAPAMPTNYLDRLTEQEFADILAYLLSSPSE